MYFRKNGKEKKMVYINEELCVGCGKCIQDCVGHALKMENGKAKVKKSCILCGHCVAVCPRNAVEISEYRMDTAVPYEKEKFQIDPDIFANAVKFRRSIRNFKNLPIEREKIEKLLEVASYTATAKNERKMKFVFVQENLATLKELVFGGIKEEIERRKGEKSMELVLLQSFYRGKDREPKEEFLFRNAPAVLYIMGERLDDAGLAAQNIEMMANALGLGVLYNGYLKAATSCSKEAMQYLDKEGRPIGMCMLIGYPAVKYLRTVPRNMAEHEIL